MENAAGVGQKLVEVEAVRTARLQTQECLFQLEQCRNQLHHKNAELQALRQQLERAALQQQADQAAGTASQAEELQLARLEAKEYKQKLGLTELELAKQLDSLRELQWQLDSVVSQLGLQGRQHLQHGPKPMGALHREANDGTTLLRKAEELAQQQAREYEQQLASKQAEAEQLRQRCTALQQQLCTALAHPPAAMCSPPQTAGAAYTFDGLQHVRQFPEHRHLHGGSTDSKSDACLDTQQSVQVQSEQQSGQAGSAVGKQLIDTLLQENGELRSRLADAEEHSRRIEGELETELLRKVTASMSPGPLAAPSQISALYSNESHRATTAVQGDFCGGQRDAEDSGTTLPATRASRPAVSASMQLLARGRLDFQLEEKDRQMAKLRAVIRELEAKLAEAYERQADLVMKEGSWREQESLDKRLAELEEGKAQLAAKVEAARSDAEAAKREAAVQRRLAKRLQQRSAVVEDSEANKQMIELLQKRVKILEGQNIKLRLTQGSREEKQAKHPAGSRRPFNAGGQPARRPMTESEGFELSAESSEENNGTRTENLPPNDGLDVGSAGHQGRVQAGTQSMLEGNPVLEKWEADKRLQKKVEALKGKLQEKTQQLTVSHGARERLDKQLKQAQAELAQAQAALKKQQILQGSSPGPADSREAGALLQLPRAFKEQLEKLDDLQLRHDALERKLAAMEQCAPRSSLAGAEGLKGAAGGVLAAGARPYRAGNYGGKAEEQESLEAQLLEKDVKIFDITLERDQTLAQVARLQQRVEALMTCCRPAAADTEGATGAAAGAVGRGPGGPAAGRAGSKKQPTPREQELLDTIALLKNALERTKKGLESGVSNSKYMALAGKFKQHKAQVAQLEAQLADGAKLKEEVARLQQQVGQLHAVNSALKSQLKAAKQQREDATNAREETLTAQVCQLERALQERDLQLVQAKESISQYGEEVAVLVEEGLHPAALVQELLTLRPRLRELQEQNEGLQTELAAFDAQLFAEVEQLRAEYELLRGQSRGYEAFIKEACTRHGEPLPAGMAP